VPRVPQRFSTLASGTSIDQATAQTEPATLAAAVDAAPVVIEARDLEKTFRIPSHRIDSLKERAVRPFARMEYRELQALKRVSFDIHRGEFFGIVGRNGSGKSTLLKILASIYQADAGTIRMAGRVAPFIELGVGFNPELTARENIVLNGVMMGLSQREARRRLDAILDFAELADFADLKLKNYSSGMMVRLAFSVMIQSDADILLIDEVLAVGDAAFQQKCTDVFQEMRDSGRTMVLVTHDMAAVQDFCHRAMLLDDGEQAYTGEPEPVARRYMQINFAGGGSGRRAQQSKAEVHTKLVEAWLENGAGERVENVEAGEPIRLHAVIEALRELERPSFTFQFVTPDGLHLFSLNRRLTVPEGRSDRLAEGERARVAGTIENPLTPGRYFVKCWVARTRNLGDFALHGMNVLDFVVFGSDQSPGLVSVEADMEAVAEREAGRP
jgi:ABC-type polysaccharide/polyol phosphate transport system ATPase subunit